MLIKTVEQVATTAISLGKGAPDSKIDTYKISLILHYHSVSNRLKLFGDDAEQSHMDGMLPFGLRSAPKTFNVLADAIEW